MPTLRLGDQERSEIRGAFKRVAQRAKNTNPFPLTDDDFPEFGYSLLEPRIAKYYSFLREEANDLVRSASWRPDFRLRNADATYTITLGPDVELPKEHLLMLETHPMYHDILKWAQGYCIVSSRVDNAMRFLSRVVNETSSTGQIKRVLSEDVLRFLPEYMMKYFADAERQSRWPSGLPTDGAEANVAELADVLALASISPEKREGMDVSASRNID